MEDWGAVRERLEREAEGMSRFYAIAPLAADIRAALNREAHMDGQIDLLAKYIMATCPERITGGGAVDVAIETIAALRQRVEELERKLEEAHNGTPAWIGTWRQRAEAAEQRVRELEAKR